MDTLVSGVKGSGKTYYAVNYINDLPDKTKVLSNIKGIVHGKRMLELSKEWGLQPIDFFRDSLHDEDNPRHDKRFLELRGFLFVIDECQKLFPKNFKDQDVLQFFQMSRHYDIDTFLLTQDAKLVCPLVSVHVELSLRAISDIANPVPGFFLYRKMVGWEQVGMPIKVRKKQEVFDMYKSADTSGGLRKKKARPMVVMLGVAILCAILAAGYFKYFTSHRAEMRGKTPSSMAGSATKKMRTNSSPPNRFNQNQESYSENSFPPSHIEKIGGVLTPLSSFKDSTGHYVILLGVPFLLAEFPYPIIKTRFNLYTVVPEDIHNYQIKYKEEIRLAGSIDPNLEYYYNDSETNRDSPSL